MSDLISRQAAIDELSQRYIIMDNPHYIGYNAGLDEAQKVIKALPPVQSKHGKWIDAVIPNDNGDLLVQVCDQCNTFFPLAYTGGGHHFCPNCGADMRTKEADCDYERAVEQLEHDMLYEPTFDPDDGSM